MPIPTPRNNETDSQFMDRCMSDPVMTSEYPRQDQRAAVCSAQLGKQKAYSPAGANTINRLRGQFRKKYKKEMTNALDKLVKPVFDEIQQGANGEQLMNAIDTIIKPAPIQDIYEKMVPEIGIYFAEREYRKAKSFLGNDIQLKSPVTGWTAKQEDEDEILRDIWMQELIKFAREDLGQNIVSVTGNSKELLRKYLGEILQEQPGLGSVAQTTELNDRLKKRWTKDRFWRAKRIVRTETTTASNRGLRKGVDATGKDYDKTWSAAFVDTRQDHIDAHGQTVGKDEYFNIGGAQMFEPGDPAGPVEQVVNCMCTETFEFKR
ncbi:MAG: hypothetical protein KGY70_18665 [Bacteroidales bacterium]|nr:hypothetical protein [Bacteroidales bacterium]